MRAVIVNAPARRRGGAIGVTGVGNDRARRDVVPVAVDRAAATIADTAAARPLYARLVPTVAPGASSMARWRRCALRLADDIAQSRHWPTRPRMPLVDPASTTHQAPLSNHISQCRRLA